MSRLRACADRLATFRTWRLSGRSNHLLPIDAFATRLFAQALIDLSQKIYQRMYVYPGHLKTVIWDFHSQEETRERFKGGMSYQSKGLLMSDYGPTHVDAFEPVGKRFTFIGFPLRIRGGTGSPVRTVAVLDE